MFQTLTLRKILLADAATCVAMGGLLTAATGTVAGLTGLPAGLLLAAGLSLFPIALFMLAVAGLALLEQGALGRAATAVAA